MTSARPVSERLGPWILVGPFLLIFAVFTAYPLLRAVLLACQQTFGPGTARQPSGRRAGFGERGRQSHCGDEQAQAEDRRGQRPSPALDERADEAGPQRRLRRTRVRHRSEPPRC